MRLIIKIIGGIISVFGIVAIPYMIFIYFFTREAPAILEYRFKDMNPLELEQKIELFTKREDYIYDVNDTIRDFNDNIENSRHIKIGKDLITFDFDTELDDLKDKSKLKNSFVKLDFVCCLKKNDTIRFNYNDYDENNIKHQQCIKVFQDEFLSKLGKYEVYSPWYKLW